MARPKAEVRKALSDAHLKAIGMVAANWSALEFTLMFLVAQESGTTTNKTFTLIAGNGINSWLQVLERLLENDGKGWKWQTLKTAGLLKSLQDLQTHRNNIVHAVWNVPEPLNKLAQLVLQKVNLPPPVQAQGLGFKKGRSTVIIQYTAADMRSVAKQIAGMREELLKWAAKPAPTDKTKLMIQALRDYGTQPTEPAKKTPPKSKSPST